MLSDNFGRNERSLNRLIYQEGKGWKSHAQNACNCTTPCWSMRGFTRLWFSVGVDVIWEEARFFEVWADGRAACAADLCSMVLFCGG